MTLISPVKYIPPFEKIESEGDLVYLLKNVFSELDSIQTLPSSKLDYTLDLISEGLLDRDIMVGRGLIKYVIDLSKAKSLVEDYREKSERGCISCIERELIHENGEKYSYCKLTENERMIDEIKGYSPKIEKYKEKGCDNIVTFFRPIAEVLKERDN